VNQFVEECRREWKRLRVPDRVANEMAADLAADLEEAESEGASAAELLGSGAPDARSFSASWAAERGVIPPPSLRHRLFSRSRVLAATAALTVIAAIGAALVIFASPDASAPTAAIGVPPEFAASRAPAGIAALRVPPPRIFVAPAPPSGFWIKPDGRGVVLAQANGSGVEINKVGSILLIVGIVGIIVSVPLALWSSRRRPGLWLASV
jgi:hypothetical protein